MTATRRESTLKAHIPRIGSCDEGGSSYVQLLHSLWYDDKGQDIAEYAVMLAVILILVVGTVRLIGSKSNTVFSNVASAVH